MNFGRILALGLFCLAGIVPLRAQRYTHISGVIVDGTAASVPGATITVVNEDTGARRAALTEFDGGYVVSSLQPGVYKITIRKDGFRTMIRFGVKLAEARPARVDFKLVVGSVQETITVEGSAPLLHSEDAAIGTVVGRDEIERLPVNGSNLLGLLELAPGVVVTPATRGESGQFTVNGQRPNTHYFTVDGASANSGVSGGGVPAQSNGGALPGMTAFGSFDSLVSLDALEQVRVQISTTVPEFGRMPGAQISLNSRSGTNEFHGSLLYRFRNQTLDANDWFANAHGDLRAPLQLHNFGVTLGGPIWRNHTFFFLSYEGMRLTQPFAWRQPVPSLDARQTSPTWVQPILNLFPTPNGPELGNGLALWTGAFSRPSRLDIGAARLDQAISSRLSAFGRFSESPSSTQFGASPVNFLDLQSRSVTFGLNWRLTSDLISDLRINTSRAESNSNWNQAPPGALPSCYVQPVLAAFFATSACDSLVRLAITGVGQVVVGSEGQRRQTQFQIGETVGLNRGAHSLSFGVDYRRLTPMRHDAADTDSIIAGAIGDFAQVSNLWTASGPLQNSSGTLQELSLFAEDTWRITPRLTATYGLRWELSPAPLSSAPVNFLDTAGGSVIKLQQPLWKTDYTNFAPRAGVAYRLTDSGRTVIRGGMGFYFDSSLSLATDLINDGPLSATLYKNVNVFVSRLLQFGFRPDLRLPLVKQWNASVEHAFDDHDVLSVGYVGSTGRDLIRREVGGQGSTPTTWYAFATNHGSSAYHGLEAQYRRRLAHGIQALVSYSWSHSIDNSSSDAGLFWAGAGLTPQQDRSSSDFDIRHSLTAGFTYEASARGAFFKGWALDGMFRARTGFPVNVLNAEQYTGIAFENIFRPDRVSGQPVWIGDSASPGSRRINPGAFHVAPDGVQGNLGRNALSGFGMSQLDLALRREFFFRERTSLQLRIEAFNALNHANFADPVRFLVSPLFGQSTSMLNLMLGTGSPGSGLAPIFQAGGSRSLQIAVRFRF